MHTTRHGSVSRGKFFFTPSKFFYPYTKTSVNVSTAYPPPPKSHRVEADIIQKSRFFHAIDRRRKKSIPIICRGEEDVNLNTSKKWLHQRKKLDTSIASRRIDRTLAESAFKMTNDQLNEMLNVEKNSVRDQSWEIQIDHFQLNCTSRTLKRACKRRTLKADRYRMIKIKDISLKNRKLRVKYDHRHKDETIESFWQYVHFTDEAHLDLEEYLLNLFL